MASYTPSLTTERIYLETSEYAILGTATFSSVQRLSDALNASDERRFLALSDVVAICKRDGIEATSSFLAVGLSHIVFASPLGNPEALTQTGNESFGLAARLLASAERLSVVSG